MDSINSGRGVGNVLLLLSRGSVRETRFWVEEVTSWKGSNGGGR